MSIRTFDSCKCRRCEHYHYWALPSFGIDNCSHMLCSCEREDWIPSDNLEYLEWEYMKKSEVKK